MNSLWQAAAAFCVLLVVPGAGEARSSEPEVDPAPEQLSDKAAEASRRGMAAIEREDWLSAIAAFKEAQQEAPFDSAVLFRLALANDKAGRELPAACWYRAYLAAAPQAANAGAVRQRVGELEKAVREKARTIVGAIAKVVPIALEDESRRGEEGRASVRGEIRLAVYLQALLGDGDGAASTLELEQSEEARSTARDSLVLGLVRSRDHAAVMAAIDRLTDPERRVKALWTAVTERVSPADYLRAAPLYADRLEGRNRDRVFCHIATLLARSGRCQEAKELLPRISAEYREREYLLELCRSLAEGGEVEAGISLAERVEASQDKDDGLWVGAERLAIYYNDVPGARRIVARITTPSSRLRSEWKILMACARAEDTAGVREAAARIRADLPAVSDGFLVAHSRWVIGTGSVLVGDWASAERELPGMEDWQKAEVCLAMVVKRLAGGDAEGAARAAGWMPKAESQARLRRLAQALIAAGRGAAVDPEAVEAFNGGDPRLLHDVVAGLVQLGNTALAESFISRCATRSIVAFGAGRDAEEQKLAERHPDALVRAYLQATAAAALFKRGELKAAREALAKARQHADTVSLDHSLIAGPQERTVHVYDAIATELTFAGDLIGLRETIRNIPLARGWKMDADDWQKLARLQRAAGDPAGARRTLAQGEVCAYTKVVGESESALESVRDAAGTSSSFREQPRILLSFQRRAAIGLLETLVELEKVEFEWGAVARQHASDRGARPQP